MTWDGVLGINPFPRHPPIDSPKDLAEQGHRSIISTTLTEGIGRVCEKVTDKLSWVCSGGQPHTESCVVCAGMASMAGTVLFLYASTLGKRSSGLGFAMSIYLWKQ